MNSRVRQFATWLFLAMGGWSACANAVYVITESVIASGGGTSTSGSTSITGTIGQAVVDTSSGGAYSISGGFWRETVAGGAMTDITVNVVVNGSGAGSIASSPAGISCAPTCNHAFTNVVSVTLNATPADGNSVFTGWLGDCTGRGSCVFSTAGVRNVTATFAPNTIYAARIDVDESGSYDALTDGLLMFRYLLGLTGASLTSGSVGGGAALTTPVQLLAHMSDIRPLLDVDGNGQADASTDGMLILRYLLGMRGNSLITGAVGKGATRSTAAAIQTYLQSILP